MRHYRLQVVAKSVRHSRIIACTVIGSHLAVCKAASGNFLIRACAVKPALESSRSFDDHLIVAVKSNDSTGPHEPTLGQLTCSVHARGGSTSLKPRTTRVRRPRKGVYNRKIKEYPRGAYTQCGSHQSNHGLPNVQPSRYEVHTSQVRNYPRVVTLWAPQ